jgi:hypothetical protein
MNWDDIEEILFDGTPEQIRTVRCPECDGELDTKYFPNTRGMEVCCTRCHTFVVSHGVPYTPNFAKVTV